MFIEHYSELNVQTFKVSLSIKSEGNTFKVSQLVWNFLTAALTMSVWHNVRVWYLIRRCHKISAQNRPNQKAANPIAIPIENLIAEV